MQKSPNKEKPSRNTDQNTTKLKEWLLRNKTNNNK